MWFIDLISSLMARKIATNKTVKRNELLDFIRPRHRGVLSTTRLNGRPQMSLVTMGLDDHERVVIATYPERVKSINARRNPVGSLLGSLNNSTIFVSSDSSTNILYAIFNPP